MTFKEKIVKLRKLKGLTQDEFASAVGVSRQAVYKWESGQSYPEVSKLLEMKVLFNISIDDLLDENYEVILPEKKKRKRIPKEVKAEIEKTVEQTLAPAVEASAEEVAPIPEPAFVAESVPAVEPAQTEAPAPVSAFVPVEEPVNAEKEAPAATFAAEPEKEEEAAKKKVGFFGRLFGRK